jgi:hypothetical protein
MRVLCGAYQIGMYLEVMSQRFRISA